MKSFGVVLGCALLALAVGACGTEDRSFVPDDNFNSQDGGPDASSGGTGGSSSGGSSGTGGRGGAGAGGAGTGGGAGASGSAGTGGGGDPCAGVVCDTPPAPLCSDANTLRSSDGKGTCENGDCVFAATDTPCVFGCKDGACEGDPCVGVTCEAPPGDSCVDDSTLRSYASQGSCELGDCHYEPVDTPCTFGCENGACKPDPCLTVECNAPPAAVCLDSTKRRSYVTPGSCDDGTCTYDKLDSNCQYGCEAGACKGDPCGGVECNVPPSPLCLDGATLRTYASTGTCAGGDCSYSSSTTSCVYGCERGACKPDPCAVVTCNSPPAAVCSDPFTRRSFGSGVCDNGYCTYSPSYETCQYGCEAGACKPDPCAGKVCKSPPSAMCLDANTRRTYASSGTCADGTCSYAPSDTHCPFGCLSGVCKSDPCQNVTCNAPPGTSCLDASTRRSYQSPGTCAGGNCTYAPVDTTCQYGCSNDTCQGNPCAGVTCDTPPGPVCASASTRRVFTSPGSCAGGACTYGTQDSNCPFGCLNGACKPDPCQSVSCNSPPAPQCAGGSTLRTFSSPGTCSGGTCSYNGYQDTPCQFGCQSGACKPDPCGGVSCNAPPDATCANATTRRTYENPGTCSGGNCSYAPIDTTCAYQCQGGVCVSDPCAGASCGDGVCSCGETSGSCSTDCQTCPTGLTIGAWNGSDDDWTWRKSDPFWQRYPGNLGGGSGINPYGSSYSEAATYTKNVNLSGCASATLSYQVRLDDDSTYSGDVDKSERLYVQCSGDGGTTFVTLTPSPWPNKQSPCGNSYCDGDTSINRSFGWTAQSISLPAACRTSAARFRFLAAGSSAWRMYAPAWYLQQVKLN